MADSTCSLSNIDAAKVPPSQFQKRKGSIYSTPSSRDGHVHGAGERDKAYHEKLKEKVSLMLLDPILLRCYCRLVVSAV